MPSRNLSRSTYRDPFAVGNPVFQRDSTCGENAVDMEDFYTPLFDVHGSGGHDWGIAEGLGVTATSGAPDLVVSPGIGIDAAGKHISLADGGSAEIGANPELNPADLVAVDANGAVIPTAGQSGTKYLVIRWWESFDDDAYQLSFGQINRYNHAPWIRLVDTAGFADDGSEIVLAEISIDGAGNVTGMDETLRRNVGISAEEIQVRRGERVSGSPNFEVDSVTAGTIRPRPGGGLEVSVADAADRVDVEHEGGGAFDKLSIAADRVVVRNDGGTETITFDGSDAWLRLGGGGVEGDLIVRDRNDREAVALNGQTAAVHIGTTGNEGDLNLRDGNNQKSIRLDGATGDLWLRGDIKDVDGAHGGISHQDLKDLTDGGTSSAHKHVLGVISRYGSTETQLGIVSGWVRMKHPYVPAGISGSVVLDFSSRTATPSGQGYDANSMNGYEGDFHYTPHAIVSATNLDLSTQTDTWFKVWYGISTTSIEVGWSFDTSGNNDQRIQFLVVGDLSVQLIGTRFATFLARSGDGRFVVKAEDLAVAGRESVICHREYLGFRLGSRLGLSVPDTRLVVDNRLGRLSVQRFIPGARHPTETERVALSGTPVGIRIALLDAVIGNHDRALRNLLLAGTTLFPIDHNCALRERREEYADEVTTIFGRWFGTLGVATHVTTLRRRIEAETGRAARLLNRRYLRAAVASIPASFISDGERAWLDAYLPRRNTMLADAVEAWLAATVDPLKRVLAHHGGTP